MSLLADAGHNLSDVLGIGLAWGAAVLAKRKPTPRRSYGMKSSSILAALMNAILLLVSVGAIGYEAIFRLFHPHPLRGGTLVWVSATGVVINAATALLFFSGRKKDLNLRATYLHMVADAGISAGVVVSGLIIMKTDWYWLDPLTSLVISALIIAGTMKLFRESVDMALHATPPGIDLDALKSYLGSLPGVTEVHDLHVWPLSTTEPALTVHLVVPGLQKPDDFLRTVSRELHERFHIEHPTVQIEWGSDEFVCPLAPEEVV
jgi:cobalt-zinc-cadmium efflux system protein